MIHLKRSMLLGTLTIVLITLLTAGMVQAAGPSGRMWTFVASPNAGLGDEELKGVAAVSTNDVWTVGSFLSKNGFIQTLTEHWNGTSWQIVHSPNVASVNNVLYGVAAVSANDVWAVGSSNKALIEHWNGTSWKIVPGPNPGSSGVILQGVSADSANDVWAVGNGSGPVLEHWNGTSWKLITCPTIGSIVNFFQGLTAISANNVWAVGDYQNGDGVSHTLIEHWNGTSCQVVPAPDPGSRANWLYGVAAVSANNVWAVGLYGNTNGPALTLTEHWNGSSWQFVPGSNVASINNALFGVAVVSASNIWAVGNAQGSGIDQTLIEHWNGTSWKIVSSPDGGVVNELLGVARVPSSVNLWAVGGYGDTDSNFQTLTEFYG